MVQMMDRLQQQWAVWGIGMLFGLVLVWLCIRAFKRYRIRLRRARLDPRKMTIADIDSMEGAEFERYLQRLFIELGYGDAEKTKDSSDFGADLVFTDRLGVRNVLQAKRYAAGQALGLDAVQEVYASMRYYDAERAIVLTTAGRFTASCATLAGVNEVCLLGRDELLQIVRYFKLGRYDAAMDMIEREAAHLLSPWQQA
ncbi:restriction endonuclease [Paenibacillus campi]|uniref:restriction endonuclease n=1 Tax=Paenibacillus campi TaxID=3106031 RepID=UPI002AFE933F|nr:restriction endonuclease [Paenibacillus sp. SGZ-1014]